MVLGVAKLYVYSVTPVLLGHLGRIKVGVVAKIVARFARIYILHPTILKFLDPPLKSCSKQLP